VWKQFKKYIAKRGDAFEEKIRFFTNHIPDYTCIDLCDFDSGNCILGWLCKYDNLRFFKSELCKYAACFIAWRLLKLRCDRNCGAFYFTVRVL